MLCKVVVRSVGNAPKLAPAEGEKILKVRSRLGIEAQLLGGMVTQTKVLFCDTQTEKPVFAKASPVFEPLKVCTGFAEELKLHLFKLTDAENEVPGGDLVSE